MNIFKKIILLSYISVASISAVMITPALPILKQSFHLSDSQLQWVVSLFLIGYIVGQLIYGPVANRIGTIKAIRLGFTINIIGIILCLVGAWQMNYMLLLFGRLITALGAAAGLACTFMLIKQLLAQHEAKQALSHSLLSFSIGIGLAVAIGGFLTQYIHWQYCFWVLLVHGSLVLASTWLFSSQSKVIKTGMLQLIDGYRHALQSKTLITYSFVVGLMCVVTYCSSAVAPLISTSFLHLNPAQYGLWNLVNIVGMFASGLIGAKLLKHYAMNKIIYSGMIGFLLAVLSLLLMWLSGMPSPLWFFISTMLLYFFSGIIFPPAAFYATHAIEDTASASSMMSFINMSCGTIAVVIVGHLPFSFLLDLVIILGGFGGFVILLRLWVKPQK